VLYASALLVGAGVNALLGFILFVAISALAFWAATRLKLGVFFSVHVPISMLVAYIVMSLFW
jgi:hypothetical protein